MTIIFRCSRTGWNVQVHIEGSGKEGQTFEAITCIAFRPLHLVNSESGKVAGEDDD